MLRTVVISQTLLEVGQQPNGEPAQVPVITVEGAPGGPNVYLQANLHGAEIQGNAVLAAFLELCRAQRPKGTFTLVPMANPIGINQKSGEFTLGRFDPISGENWNRQYHFSNADLDAFCQAHLNSDETTIAAAFRERLRAQIAQRQASPWGLKTGQTMALRLQQLALEADIVLDLHTGPISDRHLYVPEYARARAHHFNIPLNILMPSDFGGALDEAHFSPWWQLSQRFAELGRTLEVLVDAFTLELGPQEHLDPAQAGRDALGIGRYLEVMGCWPEGTHQVEEEIQHACQLADYKALYSPCGGQIEYLAPLGQPVKAGVPVARIWHYERLGQDKPMFTEVSLPCDAIPVLHFASANVQEGTELYKFLTHTFAL
ncbi:succinylglutamate desuccinylase/aspartoacylase family protein [Ferrimonas balearica]|uniref:succinylglutamate desuccinylase/aspartoacylase domain-containing protein n=1 Tax=Ferrimonas balearica TaxID=44012 RepID=UPI0039657423